MSTHSDHQINVHKTEIGGTRCSVCTKVAHGAKIGAVGYNGDCFLIGSDEAHLCSTERVLFRADCLLEKQPDVLPMFHLPAGVSAIKTDNEWSLSFLTTQVTIEQFTNEPVASPDLGFKDSDTVFTYGTRRTLTFKMFLRGARYAPFWKSEPAAREARNRNLLDRLFFRVQALTWKDFKERALGERHNYVAHQVDGCWKVAIIDPSLNISENTLQL